MTPDDLPRPDLTKGNFFQLQNVFLEFFVPRLSKPEIAIYLAIRKLSFGKSSVSISSAKLMRMAGIRKSRCFAALKNLEAHWMIRRRSKPGYENSYVFVDLNWAAQRVRTHGLFDPKDAANGAVDIAAASVTQIRAGTQAAVSAEIEFNGRLTPIWDVVRLGLKSDLSTTSLRTTLPNDFDLFENIWQHPDTCDELILWSTSPETAQKVLDKYARRISGLLISLIGFAPNIRLKHLGEKER